MQSKKFLTLSLFLQQSGNTFQEVGGDVRVNATFVTYNELECLPPSKGSYKIKISNSNTGEIVSQPASYMVYDSLCFTCNVETLTCTEKVRNSHMVSVL